jgi:hypothetical protein
MNLLIQFKKRRKGIVAVALLVGSGLILVLGALLILNLWYPQIFQGTFAGSNSLGAVFPALYFGVPLLTSNIVVFLIRLAVVLSRRTGVAFSTLLGRGGLILLLLGGLTLWHPVIIMSSEGVIELPLVIAGVMLLISGGVSLLIAWAFVFWKAGLNRVA